jgi:hypothetical protein
MFSFAFRVHLPSPSPLVITGGGDATVSQLLLFCCTGRRWSEEKAIKKERKNQNQARIPKWKK